VGEPGVGKKTIVYGLAQRISECLVPGLDGRTILSLDLAVIASGIKSRSRFEENLESILLELAEREHRLILFIDGLHMLAQKHQFLSILNVIKPGLLDGSIHCIGTATAAEYAKTVETTPWLEQLFTVIAVKPPAQAEAVQVLARVKERLQSFHKVIYSDEAIQYAVFHSSSYFPYGSLPEKAIDLIDEAGARAKLRRAPLPEEVVVIRRKVRFIQIRHDTALNNHEFEKARFYADELKKERAILEAVEKKHNLNEQAGSKVGRAEIEQIVAERTGLSLELLRQSNAGDSKP
jgi:ATP-dependent Clp protease ATP-binding subunit ClpC